MFLLVANQVAATPATPQIVSVQNQNNVRLGSRDQRSWAFVVQSVATLVQGDRALGPVVLIGEDGYFVAHQGAVSGNTANAKIGGTTFELQVVSRERNSELVLLKGTGFPETMRPFRKPTGDAPAGTLFAVLSTGPIRAAASGTRRFGVIGATRRGVPISEIRFEAPSGQFGTGLLLTDQMELYGTLNGSLATAPTTNNGIGRAFGGATINDQNIGPSSLAVAYSIGPDFVRRVMEGFLSPSHEVVFPSFGVFCVDAIGGGALIQSVRKDSPAEEAGIQANDILLDLGNNTITNQLDFARAMLRVEVGKKVVVRVRRGQQLLFREVLIGASKE